METETQEREVEERNNAPYDLTIETAVYADMTYTAGIPKTSYQDRVELMLRKWSGVSGVVYADMTYTVVIRLTRIEWNSC